MAKVLRITAKRPGFRRAGISHPDTAVDHPIGNFLPGQIDQLKSDPGLVVHETEVPDEANEATTPPRAPAAVPAKTGKKSK